MSQEQRTRRIWLRTQLEAKGRGARSALARHMGLKPDAITRMTNDPGKENRSISLEDVAKIADFFGTSPPSGDKRVESLTKIYATVTQKSGIQQIRVVGEVGAGVWREISPFADVGHDPDAPAHAYRYPPVPAVPGRYAADEQFAVKVVGPSVNRVIPDGEFAICVPYFKAKTSLTDGDLVIVERRRPDGLVEGTIKRLRRNGTGWHLLPESDDPRFQEAIALDAPGEIEVEVVALVLGKWAPL